MLTDGAAGEGGRGRMRPSPASPTPAAVARDAAARWSRARQTAVGGKEMGLDRKTRRRRGGGRQAGDGLVRLALLPTDFSGPGFVHFLFHFLVDLGCL